MQYFVCHSFCTQYSVLIFSLSSFKILQMLVQEKLYIWFRSLLCRLRKLGVHREWGMVKHVAHHFLVALYLKKMFNYSSVIECCNLLVVAAHEDNVVDTCNADLWTCHKAILWSGCCHKLHEHCWLLVLGFLPPVSWWWREGVLFVSWYPIEVLLHGGIAELFGFTRNWLHPSNLEYERSELLLSNHRSTQRLVLHFKIGWKIVWTWDVSHVG